MVRRMRRHRLEAPLLGGDISDSDFSKCSPCFGLGLKPIPVDEMTEAQIDELLLHANYELFLSRKPTLEKKKEAVCELVKIWSI